MNAKRVFVDTNVLIYAFDAEAGAKHGAAKRWITELWDGRNVPIISIQVLQEFYVNLIRKKIPQPEARSLALDYLAWETVPLNGELFHNALEAHAEWKISFWDGMIVAAATQAGADWLLTEDLSPGQSFGKVKVVSPFKGG